MSQLKALNSSFIDELSNLSDELVDLHKLTKFADLLLTTNGNYLAIKELLQHLTPTKLIELLDDCNRLDIKVIRFAIYDLVYATEIDITGICDDLADEYNRIKPFYDKLIADGYICNKEVILQSYTNLYLACNNSPPNYHVTYHFAKFLIDIGNYELALDSFTKCTDFVLNNKSHNEDLDQNQLQCPAIIDADGSKCWYVNDKHHNASRIDGLQQPAVIMADGSKHWYIDGQFHNDSRINGQLQPAIISANDAKEWYIDGKLHNDSRIDGLLQPAIIYADGEKHWYINGLYHNDSRVDGLLQPSIIDMNETKLWLSNGLLHNDDRVDGLLQPAILEIDGSATWFINGRRHNDNRINGLLQPADISNYSGSREWYFNGQRHNDSRINGILQPAIIWPNVSTIWYTNGCCHNDSRVDGVLQPAIIDADGAKYWYINGKLHNDSVVDGVLQPAIIDANGEKAWYNYDNELPNSVANKPNIRRFIGMRCHLIISDNENGNDSTLSVMFDPGYA